ncbi:hypothetical protein KAZ66_05445 [Candidatus Woesebacteria bacterium]|nr:hypothetical protein [Candidatus Woesebacteria bacterium]
MQNSEMTNIYRFGIGGAVALLVLIFGYLYIANPQASLHPTQDGALSKVVIQEDTSYILLEKAPGYFILTGTDPQGIQTDREVDPMSAIPYREFLDKPVELKGHMKMVYKKVQCIKAPCDELKSEIFVLDSVRLKN